MILRAFKNSALLMATEAHQLQHHDYSTQVLILPSGDRSGNHGMKLQSFNLITCQDTDTYLGDNPARFYVSMITKMVMAHLITTYDIKLANEGVNPSLLLGPTVLTHPCLVLRVRERKQRNLVNE